MTYRAFYYRLSRILQDQMGLSFVAKIVTVFTLQVLQKKTQTPDEIIFRRTDIHTRALQLKPTSWVEEVYGIKQCPFDACLSF